MVSTDPLRPNIRVTSVTIGTPQPHDLADFYSQLLGFSVTADDPPVPGDPDRGGWAQIRPNRHGLGPTLNLEYERQFTRPPGRVPLTGRMPRCTSTLPLTISMPPSRGQ